MQTVIVLPLSPPKYDLAEQRLSKPDSIGFCLEHVQHSLVVLRLDKIGGSNEWQQYNGCASWKKHDGTRLDLHNFNSLKTLHAPSGVFFDSIEPSPSRNSLFRLVPPSLEALEVCEIYHTSTHETPVDEYSQIRFGLKPRILSKNCVEFDHIEVGKYTSRTKKPC